ncbi:MAG TPA: hypothetical protein VMX77_01400 [Candidatus Bathyarchaeia archaeon]|nr:hypothetical protein [Candidatus Bathyarchaeia archaeon]
MECGKENCGHLHQHQMVARPWFKEPGKKAAMALILVTVPLILLLGFLFNSLVL